MAGAPLRGKWSTYVVVFSALAILQGLAASARLTYPNVFMAKGARNAGLR